MKENIIKIIKIMTYVVLVILFLVNFLILGFHGSIITITSIFTSNSDVQILLFLLVILILLGSFIYAFLTKSLNKFKIPLLLILLVLQVVFLRFSFYMPTIDKIVGIQRCIDIGGVWDNTTNKCIKQK